MTFMVKPCEIPQFLEVIHPGVAGWISAVRFLTSKAPGPRKPALARPWEGASPKGCRNGSTVLEMEVSILGPKWMSYNGKSHYEIYDSGVSLF